MTMDHILDIRDAVIDEETFVRFLKALSKDRADEVEREGQVPSPPYSSGTNGWENGSIESFLEAAATWAEATKDGSPGLGKFGFGGYSKPENQWKRCAESIYAGKI